LKRFNNDSAKEYVKNWDETKAWDELTEYYRQKFIEKLI
jgi:hypothetical protein